MSFPAGSEQLPDYDNPPIVETVLGFQFNRLDSLTNAHLGAFWKSLGTAEWPVVTDAPQLEPQFERFSEGARWGRGLKVQFSHDCGMRIRITSSDGERMVQAQNGRFHFNWLGTAGASYPRYPVVKAQFLEVAAKFVAFLKSDVNDPIVVNQWEVTYVNQVPQGTVWESQQDCSFFKLLAPSPLAQATLKNESFSGQWHFVIPEDKGRLHVEWKHAKQIEAEARPEIVSLTFTARGPASSRDYSDASICDDIDLGHEAIVQAFDRLMSEKAKKYWGIQNAESCK